MAKTKLRPLGDRVLVSPLRQEGVKTKSGLIIPETVSKERPEQGKVVAVGEGKFLDNGEIRPLNVKKGDIVLFSKYGPDEIKVDGEEYLIISESNILAVIEE
jgi:chaperonin GroES